MQNSINRPGGDLLLSWWNAVERFTGGHDLRTGRIDGHTYKIVTEAASWSDASERAGTMALGSNVGYLARVDVTSGKHGNFERRNEASLRRATMSSPAQMTALMPPSSGLAVRILPRKGSGFGATTGINSGAVTSMGLVLPTVTPTGAFSPTAQRATKTHWRWVCATGPSPSTIWGLRGNGTIWTPKQRSSTWWNLTAPSDLRVAIEEPVAGGVNAGIGMIRGSRRTSLRGTRLSRVDKV